MFLPVALGGNLCLIFPSGKLPFDGFCAPARRASILQPQAASGPSCWSRSRGHAGDHDSAPSVTLLYILCGDGKCKGMIFDLNLWGVFAMPVGLLISFGPVLVAWVLHERASSSGKNPKDRS